MANKMIEIDEVLWNKFKKKCINNDTTIRKKLSELINQYVGGNLCH